VPFIEDMASVMANVDVMVSRAGASTVTEIAAAGVASLLVPFPLQLMITKQRMQNF
jgi:UDP-N-acetylglucosamine--N-acetylmuramyl-(pentapeptide) pyrophosphoryl-undecaprenol N-acetylglucosamine transferase